MLNKHFSIIQFFLLIEYHRHAVLVFHIYLLNGKVRPQAKARKISYDKSKNLRLRVVRKRSFQGSSKSQIVKSSIHTTFYSITLDRSIHIQIFPSFFLTWPKKQNISNYHYHSIIPSFSLLSNLNYFYFFFFLSFYFFFRANSWRSWKRRNRVVRSRGGDGGE